MQQERYQAIPVNLKQDLFLPLFIKMINMRFLVADDHSIVRMGVKLMLDAEFSQVTIDEADLHFFK